MPAAETFWDQDLNLLPQQLLTLIPKKGFHLRVYQDHLSTTIYNYNCVRSGFQKAPEFRLRLALGRFSPMVLTGMRGVQCCFGFGCHGG